MADAFLTTYRGHRFYPLSPESNVYDIDDIAHALANLCRFAGHSPRFYSVAQHSVLVSQHVPPDLALRALLHDASEAYLCDLPTGVKYSEMLKGYRALESRTMDAICHVFNVSVLEPLVVKKADLIVLRMEASAFGLLAPDWACYALPNIGALGRCWGPEEAEARFLERYRELTVKTRDLSD